MEGILISVGIGIAILVLLIIFMCSIYKVADIDKALRSNILSVMCAHSLSYHTLKSGKTDAVLVLEKFAYSSDTTVSEMIDIIIVSDAVLKVHVVVDGCKDIILGDVLGNKSLDIASDST